MKPFNLDLGTPSGRRRAQLLAAAGHASRCELVRAETPSADTGESKTILKIAVMYLYGTVGAWFRGFDAKGVLDQLKNVGDDVDELHVHIHSPGGDAWDGIAIFNALRNHKAKVKTYVDGIAASAASVIALAGEEIVMGPGTQMMIHDASTYTYGNADQLREDADWIDKQSENLAGIYATIAGGEAASWRELMKAETWYHAQEAVDAGLATSVSSTTEPETAEDVTPDEAFEDLDELFDLFQAAGIYQRAGRLAEAISPTPPTASADGSTPEGKETAVAFSDEQITALRNKLGVTEDADEATMLAALDEILAEQAAGDTSPAVPDGMALIDASVLEELRNGAQQGVEARREQQEAQRDAVIDAAIKAGKTTPARRDHWVTAWKADPEGTRQLLDSLEAGLVPTSELGTASTDAEQTAEDALYAEVFGTEKKGA